MRSDAIRATVATAALATALAAAAIATALATALAAAGRFKERPQPVRDCSRREVAYDALRAKSGVVTRGAVRGESRRR